MDTLSNILNGLAYGSLLFLVASGLTITFGLMRSINLAHGAFYLIGGYLANDLYTRTGAYWQSLLIAVLAAFLLGMLMQRLFLQKIVDQELPQIILTIGIALVVGDQILSYYGGDPISPPVPPGLDGAVEFGDFVFPKFRLAIIVVAVAVEVLAQALLRYTSIGARVRAAVDDQEIARTTGLRVPLIFMFVFGAGSALAAFAGVWGGAFTSLAPDLGFDILLLALVVVVVGGLGSIPGAFIAAMGVGLVDQMGRILAPQWSMFTIYATVALFLALRPRGLLGKVEIR
ncbi:MAG: branched-chain amino acid ABC transporter permease [Actinomycetota bacterium]|nr:branched-chain amino acid ABC transporter permease [Actinomycetota bacterium]